MDPHKLEQIRKDEIYYRKTRYLNAALPTITVIILFATVTFGLEYIFETFAGFSKLAAAISSVSISTIVSYPVYSVIKTWAASEGRVQSEIKKEANKELEELQNTHRPISSKEQQQKGWTNKLKDKTQNSDLSK